MLWWGGGYTAVSPAKPKPLCKDRARLGGTSVPCGCGDLTVRRPDGDVEARLSQVLWLVEDLENIF